MTRRQLLAAAVAAPVAAALPAPEPSNVFYVTGTTEYIFDAEAEEDRLLAIRYAFGGRPMVVYFDHARGSVASDWIALEDFYR